MKRKLPFVQADVPRTKRVFSWFDKVMSTMIEKAREEGLSIPCGKGCDACCYDVALVTQYEMIPLIAHLQGFDPQKKQLVLRQLMEWKEKLAKVGIKPLAVEPDLRTYYAQRVACPLLDLS